MELSPLCGIVFNMNITVYCGANTGIRPAYIDEAKALGKWMAGKDHTLVYGGGRIGLMGVLADEILAGGGKVIGVIPTFLATAEKMHSMATEMIEVATMSERKNKMLEMGDCFVALPGGTGTLEEIAEAISLMLLGRHDKPCILLNADGFYEPLKHMMDTMVKEGFLSQHARDEILFAGSAEELARMIEEKERA